jgi:hypothetical protein
MPRMLTKKLIDRIASLRFPEDIDDTEIPNELWDDGPARCVASSHGTTATETPLANGKYAKPVFYDWNDNWPAVRALFDEEETQRVLHYTIAMARGPGAWRKRRDPHD